MTSKYDPSLIWADDVIASIYRSEWGRLLSLLIANTRRIDLCEDALSEAFARASERWPTTGIPTNPGGWLYTTASRVVLGQLRSEAIHGHKARLLAVRSDWVQPTSVDDIGDLDDERLALILLCCHPALPPAARSPLALRLVIGSTTEEIAKLFLVSRSTMAARITRAKKKIVAAGIPLSMPVDSELRTRLDDVCRTIYLAFTAGYTPSQGPDLLRVDLAGEAVELAAILHRLVPDAGQVRALYGLLLLQHSRRDSRVHNRRLVLLNQQDRSLWHQDEISKGRQLVSGLPVSSGYVEELRIQGLIAAEHVVAKDASQTDWSKIEALYGRLEAVTGSPVVRLNRAVAIGEAQGPQTGLAMLNGLEEFLSNNHRFFAVRADLALRSGDLGLARSSYLSALRLCSNEAEQQFLRRQLDSVKPSGQ